MSLQRTPPLHLLLLLAWLCLAAGPTQESLRSELLDRLARDQQARQACTSHPQDREATETLARVGDENLAWLRQLVERDGWPGFSQVGRDGSRAAFMLVQHGLSDPVFMRRCLDLMQALLPRNEVEAQDVALLTDRVLLLEGKKQLYGSQFTLDARGELQICPLEDPERVDERREKMGLPPLEDYRNLLQDLHRRPRRPASEQPDITPALDPAGQNPR